MNKIKILALFLLFPCALFAQQPVNNAVLKEAQRILDTTRLTSYQHIANIDESLGIFELDCSLLIEYILKNVQPSALNNIPLMPEMNRLQCAGFYEAMLNDKEHWQVVDSLIDAQPGDIITWRDETIQPNRNTGHIAVVAENPVRLDDDTFSVRIIDATSKVHDDDTRPPKGHGVGQGTMRFEVDEKGNPFGIYWSSKTELPLKKAIVIGRLQSS